MCVPRSLCLSFALILIMNMSGQAISQDITLATCRQNLLSLSPCAPFVQGMAPTPVQPCCDSLKQLYIHRPSCLCLLLNDTSFSTSFPMINTTLALQLPLLCNLQPSTSTCTGISSPSTFRDSPVAKVLPRTNYGGFGFHHHSAQVRLETESPLMLPLLLLALISSVLTAR